MKTHEALARLLAESPPGEWVSSTEVRLMMDKQVTRQAIHKAAEKLRHESGLTIQHKPGAKGGYRLPPS